MVLYLFRYWFYAGVPEMSIWFALFLPNVNTLCMQGTEKDKSFEHNLPSFPGFNLEIETRVINQPQSFIHIFLILDKTNAQTFFVV